MIDKGDVMAEIKNKNANAKNHLGLLVGGVLLPTAAFIVLLGVFDYCVGGNSQKSAENSDKGRAVQAVQDENLAAAATDVADGEPEYVIVCGCFDGNTIDPTRGQDDCARVERFECLELEASDTTAVPADPRTGAAASALTLSK